MGLFKSLCVVSIVSLVTVSAARAATVVVDPSNANGWTFYTTDNTGAPLGSGTGTGDFVVGPAVPPAGVGSAHFQTPAGGGDESVQLRTTNFAGTLLSDITTLKYSTYATSWNGPSGQLPYLTIWIDTDGLAGADDRIHFEPVYSGTASATYPDANPFPQADVAQGVWQEWNVLTGMVYNDNGPSGMGDQTITFANMKTLLGPTATIVDAAPGIGGFRFTSGFASAGDNFDTNVDNVIFNTDAVSTTYDFEPTTVAAAVPVPASAWAGLVLVGLLGASRLVKRMRSVA